MGEAREEEWVQEEKEEEEEEETADVAEEEQLQDGDDDDLTKMLTREFSASEFSARESAKEEYSIPLTPPSSVAFRRRRLTSKCDPNACTILKVSASSPHMPPTTRSLRRRGVFRRPVVRLACDCHTMGVGVLDHTVFEHVAMLRVLASSDLPTNHT